MAKVVRPGEMLPENDGLRGWTPDGIRTPEKLKELALQLVPQPLYPKPYL